MRQAFEQEEYEIIKKSELNAAGKYDFLKITEKQQGFLECEIEEEKEEIIFHYNIFEKIPFSRIRDEKKQFIMAALLSVLELRDLYREYLFSVDEENLYFDRNYRIYVKQRDIYERGLSCDEEKYLKEFKALIGFAMQKKYGFSDYFEGGMQLLTKNRFLKPIYDMASIEEIAKYLKENYEKTAEEVKTKKVEVNKSWYQTNRWLLTALLIMLAAGAAWEIYTAVEVQPRYRAMLQANNCYMDSNYVGVINSLKKIDLKYLDKYQKTILATAYIKSENLTPDQKEVILEKITVNGEEKLKDYWIYLGRLNTSEAINIAMQRSDDELLLYAYMTELAMLEKNTEISGEEKKTQLADLEDKIEELAEKYQTNEEEK